jgi:membrane protein
MQPNRVWTLIALAGLAAVTVLRPDRAVHKGDGDRAGSRSVRISTKKDPLVSGDPATSAIRPGVGSAWLLFRTHWGAVLWRVYQKMNENRLLAVAAGVVFYGLLAVFPAITAFVSLYGLMADPSSIHERLSLATGVLP